MQHIAKEASCFVIKIMTGGHDIILFFNRCPVKLVALDCAARRTGGAMDQLSQFFDAGACFLFNRMRVQCGAQWRRNHLGIVLDFVMRSLRIARDSQVYI